MEYERNKQKKVEINAIRAKKEIDIKKEGI